MELILVYDIATPDRQGEQRLRRVAKICESYGLRVQRSVFECKITEAAYEQFMHQLRTVIDPTTDRVTIYTIPGGVGSKRQDLGKEAGFYTDRPWIL